MDAIYRQARLVIVVLEDIAINEMEEAFLEDLMGKYNHGPAEDLRIHAGSACDASALSMKILSARWFSRIWCSHELLVSGNHIFLIRVKPRGLVPVRVLRITAAFLVGLISVTLSYTSVPDIEDERHAILATRYHESLQTGLLRKLMEHLSLNARLYHDEGDYQTLGSTDIKSFLDVFSTAPDWELLWKLTGLSSRSILSVVSYTSREPK